MKLRKAEAAMNYDIFESIDLEMARRESHGFRHRLDISKHIKATRKKRDIP